ncbi:hypothetical protein KC644_03840 [Candidatus Berkelbacteria bacterium]|nr:hypothetical protein [Candidatus Berkelbacteria bacterium]
MDLGDIEVKLIRTEDGFSHAREVLEGVAKEREWPIDKVVKSHPKSLYWLAYKNCSPAGVIKVVLGDPNKFPIKENEAWPELIISSESCIEVAIAAVKPEYRGIRDVFLAMFAKMYADLSEIGITEIYAILDRKIQLLYKRVGLSFEEIPESAGGGRRQYWGEETFPAVLNLPKTLVLLEKKQNRLWQLVCVANSQKDHIVNRRRKAMRKRLA